MQAHANPRTEENDIDIASHYFLIKPLDIEDLIETVRSALE